jgi:transposase
MDHWGEHIELLAGVLACWSPLVIIVSSGRRRRPFVLFFTGNQIRGLLAKYGLVIAQSPEKVRPALVRFLDEAESGLTAFARDTFSELYEQLKDLESRIERVTHRVDRVYRAHPVCRKLAALPGIGPLTATALLATVGRPQAFHNGRHLAAWLGLVPRHIPVEARRS